MKITILWTATGKWWAVVTNRNGMFFAQGPFRDSLEEARADGAALATSVIVETSGGD